MPVLSPPFLFRTAVSVFALALSCGVSPVWAAGETILFDGSDPTMLGTPPLWSNANSLFPAASFIDNFISVTGGDIGGDVYGGLTTSNNAIAIANNHVTISGGSVGKEVTGGHGSNGAVTGNGVTIAGGVVSGWVMGGYNYGGDNADNHVTISDGLVKGWVFGGYSSHSDTTGNYVTISGGRVEVDVTGGRSDSGYTADGNYVTISNGSVGGDVIGGLGGAGAALNNYVIISNGSVEGDVIGGSGAVAIVAAAGNHVTISGGSVGGDVYGGVNRGSFGAVTGNSVTISNGSVAGDIYGGFNNSVFGDEITGNSIAIATTGKNYQNIYGGQNAAQGPFFRDLFTGNVLTLNAGNSIVSVHNMAKLTFTSGGDAGVQTLDTTATGAVGAPKVTIDTDTHDVAFGGDIIGTGGVEKTGSGVLTLGGTNVYTGGTIVTAGTLAGAAGGLQGDIVNNAAVRFEQTTNGTYKGAISGAGSVEKTGAGALILGGINTYTGGTDVRAGTLILKSSLASTLSVASGATLGVAGGTRSITGDLLANNAFLDFYAPGGMGDGAVMLIVTGAADIANSTVNVGIEGGSSPLQKGDTLTLIKAAALNGDPSNSTADGRGMQGVSLLYEFDILTDAANNQLLATVTAAGINPQTKALSEGRVAGMAFVGQGADLIAGQGMNNALAATKMDGFSGFGAIGGASSRYDTGSHVDVDGVSVVAGLGGRASVSMGSLLLGAFVEAGWGNYDSYNSFANAASVKGDGDVDYYGGGVLGRLDFDSGVYGEASLRAGRSSTNFSSNDLVDGAGQRANYDSSAAYYGAHAGLGYIWPVNDMASLDLSTKYLWTHQNGDSVNVANDPVRFESSNSHRWRNGARFNYAVSTPSDMHFIPYVGLAYDYEFDGKAKATVYGYALETPSLKGGTGIGELGVRFKPAKDSGLSVDLGVQGYVGVREGVAGTLQAKYNF